MKRIMLFLITNLAVILILSIVLRVLEIDRILDEQGIALNLNQLLIFAALFGFGGAFVSLALSKWTAKRLTGAQVIAPPRNEMEAWLLNTVKRQAAKVGIGMPEVAIFDSPAPNAFATGMWRNRSLVAVSTGLLRTMSREEVEGVLGHEISHVANGDMVTLALMQGVVNTFVIFFSRVVGFVVDRVIFRTQRGHGPGFLIATLLAQVVLGILATIIVLWFSRRREFRADAGSAALEGREKMIAALKRLQRVANPQPLPGTIAAFGILGSCRPGIRRLFMTHPPLEERIEALAKRNDR